MAKKNSIFKSLDFFGYTPELLYDRQKVYKTTYGGLITIFIGLSYILAVAFTVWRFFDRNSPETNANKLYTPDPVGFNLNHSTFSFAFGLEGPDWAHYVDPSIYTIKFEYMWAVRSLKDGKEVQEWEVTPVDTIPCSQADLNPKHYQNLDLKNIVCMNPKQSTLETINITGRFESKNFGHIRISFDKCKNSSDSEIVCKTQEEIDKKIEGGYIAVYYVDRDSKPTNYQQPVEEFPGSFFGSVSKNYQKTYVLYMENYEIKTDSSLTGYMEPKLDKFVKIGRLWTDIQKIFNPADPNSEITNICSFAIRMDPTKTSMNRAYKKIYEYLAEFGGIAQVIMITGLLLTFQIKKTSLQVDLAKKIIGRETLYQQLVHSNHSRKDSLLKRHTFMVKENLRNNKNSEKDSRHPSFPHSGQKTSELQNGFREPENKTNSKNESSEGTEEGVFHKNDIRLSYHNPCDLKQKEKTSKIVKKPKYQSALRNPENPDNPDKKTLTFGNGAEFDSRGSHDFGKQNRGERDTFPSNSSQNKNSKSRLDNNIYKMTSSDLQSNKIEPSSSKNPENSFNEPSNPQNSPKFGLEPEPENLRDEEIQMSKNKYLYDSRFDHESEFEGAFHQSPYERYRSKTTKYRRREKLRIKRLNKQIKKIGTPQIFFQSFFPCLAGKSKVNSMVDIVRKQIYSKYDFIRIVTVIEEFEKLKNLLMTPDEQILFDVIPNSKIKYGADEEAFSIGTGHDILTRGQSQVEKTQESVLIAFKRLSAKPYKSQLEKNILTCLGFLYAGDTPDSSSDEEHL